MLIGHRLSKLKRNNPLDRASCNFLENTLVSKELLKRRKITRISKRRIHNLTHAFEAYSCGFSQG